VNSFGGLDVIVNNAGVQRWTRDRLNHADEFRELLRVNALGVILVYSAAARVMRDGGSVINVSSVGGSCGDRGVRTRRRTGVEVCGSKDDQGRSPGTRARESGQLNPPWLCRDGDVGRRRPR